MTQKYTLIYYNNILFNCHAVVFLFEMHKSKYQRVTHRVRWCFWVKCFENTINLCVSLWVCVCWYIWYSFVFILSPFSSPCHNPRVYFERFTFIFVSCFFYSILSLFSLLWLSLYVCVHWRFRNFFPHIVFVCRINM